MTPILRTAAAVALLALGACVGEGHITEPFDLSKNQSLAVDAQQRVITNVALPAGQERARVVCAEPSPDVMAAIAKSLGAGIAATVTPPTGGTAVDARAELARSYGQKLAQLGERTNTIQLLRDSLYRACEAYANGAITKTTYALLLSRYDSLAVTLAMGELAAGAFGRPPAVIGAGTTASTTIGQGERPSVGSQTGATPDTTPAAAALATARGDTEVARTLLLMQEAYLLNNAGLDLGPVIASCITALADKDAVGTKFTAWCEGVFASLGPTIAQQLPTMIRTTGELQRRLIEIETERQRAAARGTAPSN
jgi:hypothetical protein